ncbi:primosomal protein DnaI [Metabacillus sp. GX 13764]|uniref:primosomal protein DnaI n=1 Tax=Metabacillus kandeliae TaxID=2900151 RepID=UPI001E3155E8|nr:primosomal protein DnaI [Metabacillus kandeliae]MCD7032816.1 primosomal protein DnaI [Metabacillus kandeliae]
MEPIGQAMKNMTGRKDFMERLQVLKKEVTVHPDIKPFLESHKDEIDEKMIDRSLIKLYEFIGQSKNCANCPSLSECRNMIQGYHPELVIQGKTIDLQYDVCPSKAAYDERKKHESLIKSMYIPKDILAARLDNIDLDEATRLKAVSLAQDFIESYTTKKTAKGLYIHGPFGVGKTYILGAIANELAENRISSMLVYLPEFMRELKNSLHDHSLEPKMDAVKTVPVLMLDDLGAESMSSWLRDDILGTILQYRMLENLPTFFSSNFDLKQLNHHLSFTQRGEEEPVKAARIMERIKHLATPVALTGKNRREV